MAFTSCEQTESLLNEEANVKNQNYFKREFKIDKVISLDDAKLIGQIHNDLLQEAIINYPTTQNDLKTNFKNLSPEIPKPLKDELFSYFKLNDTQNIELEIKNNLPSDLSKKVFDNIKNVIYDNNTFIEKSLDLDLILSTIDNMSGNEKEILLVFLETSRASLKFWMPTDLGGLGNYDNYIDNIDVDKPEVNWSAIAYSDGAGAAGTLLRTWALASFGPLSWGAIVGAEGFGAAWASGASLLYQLM